MKLLKKGKKDKKTTKCSNQKRGQVRKAAEADRVLPIPPVDGAKAHVTRVAKHLEKLKQINGAYVESTQDCYADSKASLDAKKAQLRKNMRGVGAALGSWHAEALDILAAGTALKVNLADQHKELTRALGFFGAPRIN